MRFTGRLITISLLLMSLWGCTVLRPAPAPLLATVTPTPVTLSPGQPAPSATPAQLPSTGGQVSQPTYTPLPTYTPYPTQPPNPTYTPYPNAPVPSGLTTPVTPGTGQPIYNSTLVSPGLPQTGRCCTLRVRNQSSRTLWIGTDLPTGGNYIEPRWYIEFYLNQPGSLQVYWCDDDYFSGQLFDCNDAIFDVPTGVTEVEVD